MELVDFETWWNDFLANPRVRCAKDGGYDAIRELTRYTAALSPEIRVEFVDELTGIACRQTEGWSIAVASLEENWTQQTLERIADHVCSLKASTDPDARNAVCCFLRFLARSADPDHRELLEEYLLVGSIGPDWPSVPWAVWPDDPDLFGRSWARYFSTKPTENSRDTINVQAFLRNPDALACVRDALRNYNGAIWGLVRDAVLAQLGSPWLTEVERERVTRVCEAVG